MDITDPMAEAAPPDAESGRDLPLPSDPKTLFLGGLLLIAVLVVANLPTEIVLPSSSPAC